MATDTQTPQDQTAAPSYEELVKMYNELVQNKSYEEAKTRLAFCIEVVKLKKEFPAEYVKAVTKEIMTILPMAGVDPDKALAKKTKKSTVAEEE